MIGVAAKVFAVIPLILGGLALVATKALVIAKIAFIIVAVIGLQKVLSGGGGLAGLSKVTRETLYFKNLFSHCEPHTETQRGRVGTQQFVGCRFF